MVNRRPQLELIAPGATAAQTAAIVAALEQFMRERTLRTVAPEPAEDPWQRAALLEGASRSPWVPQELGTTVSEWGTG